MEIGNNILVRFFTYNDEVKYDTYGGSFVVFDNTDLIGKLPTSLLLFTGIKFKIKNLVKIICRDAEDNIIDHSLWDGWLYLEPKSKKDFIGIISFVPQQNCDVVEEFYGNFLEVKHESI